MPTTITPPNQRKKPLPLQDPNNPDQPVPVVQQNQPASVPPQAPAPTVPTAPVASSAPTILPQQVQPVSGPQTGTNQLASQLLQQAAGNAQSGYQGSTAGQTSQLTQQLLQDPNQDYDPSQAVRSGLTQYDRGAAQAIETARQGMVGASGSSLAQSGLMDFALRTAEGREDLRGSLEQSASETARNNALAAIAAGQSTAGMEQAIQSGNIQNLLSVLKGAEPQLQREETAIDRGLAIAQANQNAALQTSLTELQGKIDQGLMLTAQDFEAVQNELDRDIARWTSEGNWENALSAITLKGEIDLQAQQTQQTWTTGERVATQGWMTGERLSEQDFVAGQSYLDRVHDIALQENDIATTKWVEEKRSDLALAMQMKDMDHDTKMAYLSDQLANATADKDVVRQERLMKYQSGIRLGEMEKEHGYNVAIETLRGDIQTAIAEGNHTNAMAMLTAELDYKVNNDIENRKLDWAANALEEKGLDMAILQQQLDNIDDMIENYGIDPTMKMEFVKATLEGQGIDTSQFAQIDVNAEAQKALAAEFDTMLYQFGQSHPELIDKGTGELTPEGLQAFNDYYNFTMYGELSPEMKEERRTAGFLGASDIPLAQEGEKFIFNEGYPTGYEDNPGANDYSIVPPGEYTVVTETYDTGSKFFGTLKEHKKYFLQDVNGNKYHIRSDTGGAQGNKVSDLWAQ